MAFGAEDRVGDQGSRKKKLQNYWHLGNSLWEKKDEKEKNVIWEGTVCKSDFVLKILLESLGLQHITVMYTDG